MIQEILWALAIWAVPAVLAITLHEAAHGYAALRLGDDTAQRMGRLSLNPLRHVDPFGTVLLPGLLLLAKAGFVFGYAKPVPVNFGRLRRFRRDMVLVAAAGPAMNLFLALASAVLYHGLEWVPVGAQELIRGNLLNSITINVLLAVFNMLPIPPLDGGRVALGILPPALARPFARLERFGIFVVLGLFVIGPQFGFDVAEPLLLVPARAVIDVVVAIAGLR